MYVRATPSRLDEPVQNFTKLTQQQDSGLGFLRRVADLAPQEMPALGRAWVQRQLLQSFIRSMKTGGNGKKGQSQNGKNGHGKKGPGRLM